MSRPRVFICATQADDADARSLERALKRFRIPRSLSIDSGKRQFAKPVFWSHEQEQPRVKLVPESVLEPIRESEAMIVLCTPAANVSKWLRMEIAAFIEAKPWAPVVAVVRSGEPYPEHSTDAFVKPCFPPNLPPDAVRNWIDAREADWEEIVGPGALAQLIGKRPEQLAHHAVVGSGDLKRQRLFAIAGAVAGVLLAVWIARTLLHGLAMSHAPGYAENLAPHVQPWIPASSGAEITELELVERDPFSTALRQNPEALQAALGAWLDKAEAAVDEHPDQALRWTDLARQAFESLNSDVASLRPERYRFHALSAILAKNSGEDSVAQTHLETAIGHWTSIPAEDLAIREKEGFVILESVSGDPVFSRGAEQLLAWLRGLAANESAVLTRAVRLAELARGRPDFAESIENTIAALSAAIDPPSAQPAFARAWLASIQSGVALERGERERGAQILTDALAWIDAEPETAQRDAVRAQLSLDLLELEDPSDTAIITERLDAITPALEAGALDSSAFAVDAFMALDWRADLHLAAGEDEAAAQTFERALPHAPEVALVRTLLKTGFAFHYSGDHESAAQAFAAVLQAPNEPEISANRLTALRGSILATQALGQSDDAQLLAGEAAELFRQIPDYQTPPFLRDPLAKVVPQQEAPVEDVEPSEVPEELNPVMAAGSGLVAEISAVRKKITALEAERASRANFAQMGELRELYSELNRLQRQQLTGDPPPPK